jgi:hypothetical protein
VSRVEGTSLIILRPPQLNSGVHANEVFSSALSSAKSIGPTDNYNSKELLFFKIVQILIVGSHLT